ncbi:hypothetical protein J6590_078890, partial [Homalodisca vitripennis]
GLQHRLVNPMCQHHHIYRLRADTGCPDDASCRVTHVASRYFNSTSIFRGLDNNRIQQLNERYKHLLHHSIESDTRLMQYTDQVFLANTMRRASAADCGVQFDWPSRASAADCGVQCDLPSDCRDQRCAEIRDLVASLRITIEVLEAEIQWLKVHYNKKRLQKTPMKKKCSPKGFAIVAHHSGEPRKKRRGNSKQRISLPFSSIIIEGVSHTRGLTGILRRMVTCETVVGGVCKPGAKLMEATSDDSPPAGGCYVIVAGTNDVASGQQYNIYRNLERRITSKLRTSRVVVSTLPHRHDLPASHKINQETVLINNYIEEFCESIVGQRRFYTTWDASKEEHQASAGPGINRRRPNHPSQPEDLKIISGSQINPLSLQLHHYQLPCSHQPHLSDNSYHQAPSQTQRSKKTVFF